MNTGYIKLHRQLLDSNLWLNEPFTKAQAWIDLLFLTSYKPSSFVTKNGEIIKIERGQCAYSLIALGNRWKWSRNKVKRFMDYLVNEKRTLLEDVGNRYVITVLNYSKYQGDTINGQQTIQQTIQQTDTFKEGKKERSNTTTILEQEQKIFGKYNNVALTAEQYNRLFALCLSKEYLAEVIDSLSTNIEEGKEQPYRDAFPNAHSIRLEKYLDYRRKNPQKFKENFSKTEQNQYNTEQQALDAWLAKHKEDPK